MVSIVVPAYNRMALTRQFLQSFQLVTYPNFEIIVVDDGSTDGTPEMIARDFPRVRLLRQSGNLWWTKATNIGIRDALARNARYILTINDDVTVEPGFLSALVAHAGLHPRTLVGSLIYRHAQPSMLWYAGGTLGHLSGNLTHRTAFDPRPPAWLTGMGTLIPVTAFDEIGLYDEDHFPQYAADADFSLRAKKHGWSLAIAPGTAIWNRTEESSQLVIRKRVTLQTLFLPLFSLKSDSLLRMRVSLYRKHWPFFLQPVAFFSYYTTFAAKQTKRLILGS
jgi:GT2 family glycosyltransferase